MLIKPKEAREMICPKLSLIEPDGITPFKCRGCDCMMWRWVGEDQGYCGMAGRPLDAEISYIRQALPALVREVLEGSREN